MPNRRFTPCCGTLLALAVLALDVAAPVSVYARSARAPGHRTSTGRAHVVNVVAREFAFDMPDTLHAGITTLRLHSAGRDRESRGAISSTGWKHRTARLPSSPGAAPRTSRLAARSCSTWTSSPGPAVSSVASATRAPDVLTLTTE